MSKFKDLKKSVDEGKDPAIALHLEDGSYLYCGLSALFVVDDKDYAAFYSLEEDDPEIFFLRVTRDDEDEVDFEDIEDVQEYFKALAMHRFLKEKQEEDESK